MENNKPSRRIHPLVAGAAVSVMVVSLTGVAALTGLLPSSHSSDNNPVVENSAGQSPQTPLASSVGAATAAASPANLVEQGKAKTEEAPVAESKPVPHHTHATHTGKATQPRSSYAESTVAAQAPEICSTCGRVESVQAIPHAAKPSGLGVAAGAVLGGILGNQVGNGNGRTLATIAGAVGGGYAGNAVEKRTHTTTNYQVRVRMDDGSIRTFPYAQQPAWSAGDRVRVVDGQLTARG
ncbi:MAG TPA: glycine zipper 2TM domain-containing protein [Noviherbaspirillum sp.]